MIHTKNLKQSQTLRRLLLCFGLIVLTMGATILLLGLALGPPLLMGAGLCLTLVGAIFLGTSIYLAHRQQQDKLSERSTSSAQAVSSRKVSVVIRPSLPSVAELSGESLGSTIPISDNSNDSAFIASSERPSI
ncbi:hypothetical protein BIW11_12267 [Tropilaelaps mercedesae]|uniref:Uncharacterized protein n=1 Tax=Tropilaelaps mercedesae TaxID=418985 RepID=A0A1V9X7P7_9ACAR|nr:hypothetical protein BIW11_12267 [Tropilaelaps mercedesae]